MTEVISIRRLTEEEISEYEDSATVNGHSTGIIELPTTEMDLGWTFELDVNAYDLFKVLQREFGEARSRPLQKHLANHVIISNLADSCPSLFEGSYWHYYLLVETAVCSAIVTAVGTDSHSVGFVDLIYDSKLTGGLDYGTMCSDVEDAFKELIGQSADSPSGRWQKKVEQSPHFKIENIHKLYFEGAHRLGVLGDPVEQRLSTVDLGAEGARFGALYPSDIRRSQFFLLMASFEGFLNLLYEVYLEPEIRSDTRVASSIQREHLDFKVRVAPTRCFCFKPKKLISDDGDVFKKFQYLLGLRNDFIHANISTQMKRYRVQERSHSFWVRPGKQSRYGLPTNAAELQKEHITFVFEVIEGMVELVLKAMKPTYRRDFSAALQRDEIEIEVRDDEYVIVG
jgi:hypothetical protein